MSELTVTFLVCLNLILIFLFAEFYRAYKKRKMLIQEREYVSAVLGSTYGLYEMVKDHPIMGDSMRGRIEELEEELKKLDKEIDRLR